MTEKDILKTSARTLLDRQITIEIDVLKPTFWEKLFKRPTKKVFLVNRPCLSTLIYFSELVLDLTPAEQTFRDNLKGMLSAISNDGPLSIKILALLIEDTDQEPSKKLQKFIGKNLDAQSSKDLLTQLISRSGIESFTSTTILLNGMSLLKTEGMIAFEKLLKQTIGEPLEQQ